MESLLEVTVLFTLVLALALIVERLLEILKALADLLDSRFDWYRYWTRKTIKLKDRLENRLRMFEYVDPKFAAPVLNKFREVLLNGDSGYSGTVPVLSGDLVRAFWLKSILKFIGIAAGIGLAFTFKINLVSIWLEYEPESLLGAQILSPSVQILLTGIAIGLGSGPVHKIITSLEKKRKETLKQAGAK